MPRRIIEPDKRADLASTLRHQYEGGLSVRKVADAYGLSYNLTYRLLREANTQMRPARSRHRSKLCV